MSADGKGFEWRRTLTSAVHQEGHARVGPPRATREGEVPRRILEPAGCTAEMRQAGVRALLAMFGEDCEGVCGV